MFRVARNLKKEEMDFKQYFTEVEKAMRNVSRRPAKKSSHGVEVYPVAAVRHYRRLKRARQRDADKAPCPRRFSAET